MTYTLQYPGIQNQNIQNKLVNLLCRPHQHNILSKNVIKHRIKQPKYGQNDSFNVCVSPWKKRLLVWKQIFRLNIIFAAVSCVNIFRIKNRLWSTKVDDISILLIFRVDSFSGYRIFFDAGVVTRMQRSARHIGHSHNTRWNFRPVFWMKWISVICLRKFAEIKLNFNTNTNTTKLTLKVKYEFYQFLDKLIVILLCCTMYTSNRETGAFSSGN